MKLKYEFTVTQVCGAWCAVPVGKSAKLYSGVISLNETAAQMMKYLSEEISEEELVQKMLAEYDITEEKLRADVHEFIAQLEAQNLLC